MEPKKKSLSAAIIPIVTLVLTVYFCMHAAASWTQTQAIMQMDSNANSIVTFLDVFAVRLETMPLQIDQNTYTKQFVLNGCLVWLIGYACYASSRKKYIAGKEHGTARWGTASDIKKLFANNIEKQEIKRAKMVRYPVIRLIVKWQLFAECNRMGKLWLARLTEDVEDKIELKKVKRDVKNRVAVAKLEAWPPAAYRAELICQLKDIASMDCMDAQKQTAKQQARADFKRQRHDYFFDESKIDNIRRQYKDADMILTATEHISLHNKELNNNILVFGGAGSLKTRGFGVPNILQAHCSYVVTDPKGEELEKTGYFWSKVLNLKLRVLNLDDKANSDGYNPFVYVHPERPNYEERVLTLVETLIMNTDGGQEKNTADPFWEKAEKLFLQAIFFFVVDGFVSKESNMNTVLELIEMLQIREDKDEYNSDLDYFVKIFAAKFGEKHIGVRQFKEFRTKASGKTAKSIVISAVARLAPCRSPGIQRIFSYDTLQLDRIGEEKTALYVVLPPTDKTYMFVTSMMFSQLFQEIQFSATQIHKHDGQRLPVPVRCILDEFANTCKIPNFVQFLAYARSFGVGIVPILQSLEQLKAMYKDEWGVVIDNCNSMLYLGGISHMDTLEYISKLLGTGTYDKRTTGRTKGMHGSWSTNNDVIGRELLKADEIRRMPREKCLLFVAGRPAFYSNKYDLANHKNYIFTSEANQAYSFEYIPCTHGEYEMLQLPAPPRQQEPSQNAVVATEAITIDTSAANAIRRISKDYAHMVPVPDAELSIEPAEAAQIMDMLLAAEKQADILIDQDIASITARLRESADYMVPVPDEELYVNDGSAADDIALIDRLAEELDALASLGAEIQADDDFQPA